MLVVLGASHHDLEPRQLDRLAAGSENLRSELADLIAGGNTGVDGAVVVATCNRIEVYLDAARFHEAIELVSEMIAGVAAMDVADVSAALKVRVGAPVAAHLFTVACGLDSMVVGEAEISGQVSKALTTAQAAGMTTPVLHALFQGAARTAKQVATRTPLGGAGRSVASVGLDLAFATSTVAPTSALLVGTGAYARVVVAQLRKRGCTELFVYSPSGRADAFAASHEATPITDLTAAMAKADLIVTCSGHHPPVLDLATVSAALGRRDRDLVIVDLALHSDVEPVVHGLDRVRIVDLHTVSQGVPDQHHEAVIAAQDLVIAAVARFEEDQVVRTLDPAVVALRRHVGGAMKKELDRLRAKYPDSDVASEVELALHRVTQSLLHAPTMRARELARSGDADDYLQALHTLFGIEIPSSSSR